MECWGDYSKRIFHNAVHIYIVATMDVYELFTPRPCGWCWKDITNRIKNVLGWVDKSLRLRLKPKC